MAELSLAEECNAETQQAKAKMLAPKEPMKNIDVDYTPNGWSTTNDGSPVQTTLSISFQEIEILDRDKLVKGNY